MTELLDLKGMCEYYLNMAAKGRETVPVPPELIITLLDRITDLETDIANPNSYIHDECRQRIVNGSGH